MRGPRMLRHLQLMLNNSPDSGTIWREPAAGGNDKYAAGGRLADKKTAAQEQVADRDDFLPRSNVFSGGPALWR